MGKVQVTNNSSAPPITLTTTSGNFVPETNNVSLISHSSDYPAHIMQGQEKKQGKVHLTIEPALESSSSCVPPSPEQVIPASQVPDQRPIFSRNSVDNKVVFPTRMPSQNPVPDQYSAFFASVYSIFNKAYATWTGSTEESKSPEISSPGLSNYSSDNPPNAKSEQTGRERDRYEAWPFIGTASHYDLDKYASEDQDESFETA